MHEERLRLQNQQTDLLVCFSAIALLLLCRLALNLIRDCKYRQFTKAVEEFSYSSSFDFDASFDPILDHFSMI